MGIFSSDEQQGDWALVTPVDVEVERERHNYKTLEERIIKCADCGLKLVEIIKVKENDGRKAVLATCPCGGGSFLYEVEGQTLIQAVEGMSISDMPIETVDGVMHITIEVIKNES